jgi:ABC-type nitrate/sulfonate/bicarbonate transport system permease component
LRDQTIVIDVWKILIYYAKCICQQMSVKLSEDDRLINAFLDSSSENGNIIHIEKKRHVVTKGLLYMTSGVFFVLLSWSIIAWLHNEFVTNSLIQFPTVIHTFGRLLDLLMGKNMFGETLFYHVYASLRRWLIGYGIAVIIGLTTGLILGYSSRLYQAGMVPVCILQMIPGLAWIPIAMLIFGLGDLSAIFIIGMTAIAPIILNVSTGIRQVPPVNVRVARMVGSSNLSLFFKVLLPYAVLDINNGLRIGMANAWRVLIAAEMVVGVAVGLGYSISQATYTIDYLTAFSCIIVICFIGLFVEKIFFAEIEKFARHRMGMEKEL